MCITNNLIFYDCNTGQVGKASKEPVLRQSNPNAQINNQPPSTMFVSKALNFWYMIGDVRDEQWFLPDTAQLLQPTVAHFLATWATRFEVSGFMTAMAIARVEVTGLVIFPYFPPHTISIWFGYQNASSKLQCCPLRQSGRSKHWKLHAVRKALLCQSLSSKQP